TDRMAGVWLSLVLLASFFGLSLGEPLYILMAPNLFRLDSPENVFLEAQGTSDTIHVTIKALMFPGRQSLSETTVELNSANKHQALKALKIPSKNLQRDTNQYAYLSADFKGNIVESVVLLSFQSGYVFVQTDKPIYNPTDTVMYRAFVTSTAATAIDSSVTIEFKNPQGIVINSVLHGNVKNGILTTNYKLPEVVNEGIWQLTAQLDTQSTFITEFQVKEHVLPPFEVILNPRKKFFHIDDKSLVVEISASYVYGEEVKGSAYVVFGYEDLQRKRHTFSSSLQRVELAEGTATLTKEHITKEVKDIKEIVECSIFVKATVFTETGSDMVQAEKTGIKIVTSPYKIHFTRTIKYFKPDMPFWVTVYVTNPDGSPAENIPIRVEPGSNEEITESNGMAKISVRMQESDRVKTITVKTQVRDLPAGHQAKNQMTAEAYSPEDPSSRNYLYINVPDTEIRPGKKFTVVLLYYIEKDEQANAIQFLSYLILSKGRIIDKGRVDKLSRNFAELQLTITKEMIPSFRIVAYYTLPLASKAEIVSDSVWVDVTDTCMGKLVVSLKDKHQEYRPGDSLNLKVNGDPGAIVGLVAVDKAVFLLNNKNKLTQTKIWDEVEKKDIGCTPGGGKNSMGVFTDAGLLFKSNTGGMTTTRQDLKCPSDAVRKVRSLLLTEDKVKLESQIQDEQLKICCRDGMKDIPMDYSCERRSRFITEGPECAKVFLRCCTEIANKKKQLSSSLVLSRSAKELLSEDDIRVRTKFPESWLWQDFVLPAEGDATGSLDILTALPDTITDWEVLAISSSPITGVCVSSPLPIRVKMNFFVDLRLPYAVIRNEQVEIKAVLYNYDTKPIKVRVELMKSHEICSMASYTGRFRQDISIEEKSSRLVPFTIIPLALGEPEIEVRANVYGQLVGDAVRKKLRVLPEGVKRIDEKIVILNPSEKSDGREIVTFEKLSVGPFTPNTEPVTHITVTGHELEETIRNAISGSALTKLIRLPGGCVEQNLASMTFPVIAMHYLDKANAWASVGVQNREKTTDYVKTGYSNQLAYRLQDGSYPPYSKKAPSTWLTAYVAKVFSVAYPFTVIHSSHVCEPLEFLFLKKQLPNGAFTEEAPVSAVYMMGGAAAGEGQVTLTAFILISMAEAKVICKERFMSLSQRVTRSAGFLKTHLPTLTRPYSVAITAYALALSNQNDASTLLANLERSGTDGRYWKDSQSHYYTLEATGYALLTYLRLKKMDTAARIYKWLIEQGNSSGGFGSTQTTMVVFQALAQYKIEEPVEGVLELNVDISISGRSTIPKWYFKLGGLSQAKSEKVKLDQNFTVEATGTGRGKLAVVTEYYVLPKDNQQDKCQSFDLEVAIKEAVDHAKAPERTIRSYTLDICMRYLGDHDATMTILDISLPTGCVPSLENLQNQKLQNRVDRYIDHFNLDKELSERGSLIIHLYKVLNETQCLSITLHQMFEVKLIQPSSVTIYGYYTNDIRCTRFYHPVKKQAQLGRICRDSVCRCAEESCSALKKKDEEITVDRRLIKACTATNYVFKAKLIKRNPSSSYEEYIMEIEAVLKQGDELFSLPVQRMFLSHVACRDTLGLREGQKYFIIGRPQDQLCPKTDTDP
uniref:Complement C3-like n=1 Tax=Lepisosteus oculatus TaxID=7918 RepID=W5LVL6_LEPOC